MLGAAIMHYALRIMHYTYHYDITLIQMLGAAIMHYTYHYDITLMQMPGAAIMHYALRIMH